MSLKPEDLLEENIKESRLMQRLLLGTTLAVLAFGLGRDDARTYQSAYRELNLLAGLRSSDYLDFAKSKVPEQVIANTEETTVLLLDEREKAAEREHNDQLAATIDRAKSLAMSLRFFPMSTAPESPLELGSLRKIRDSMSSSDPYVFEPDYVELVGSIERILGSKYDASMSVHTASWADMKCDPALQRYAKCRAVLSLNLDRPVGTTREVFRTLTAEVNGQLSMAYTATFGTWIETVRPELEPLDKTEPLRRKAGMGGYRHALPSLSAIWDEVEGLTVSAAREAIRKRLEEQLPRVTLFSVSVSGEWAYFAGAIALLLLSTTAAAQFQNLLYLLRGAAMDIRRYPWTILHADRLSACALILTVVLLPASVNALLGTRAVEARMNTSSLSEAFSVIRADRAIINDVSGGFEFLVEDTRDRWRSNLFFTASLAIATLATFAFGIRAGVTLSRIRDAANADSKTPIEPTSPNSNS